MSKALMAMCVAAIFFVPAAAQAQRTDPQQAFAFGLIVDKISFGGANQAFFKSVGGLKSETDVAEYREGGENNGPRKVPGPTKYSNIVLKRGFTGDTSFSDWRKPIENGVPQPPHNGVLILYDTKLRELARWNLTNVWPSALEVGPDADGNIIETLTITVDKMQR